MSKKPLNVQIIGSNPTNQIREICRRNNWNLYGNVSDNDLDNLMAKTNFVILPFEYSAGTKLKLLFAMGSGVPFMATTCSVTNDYGKFPSSCLINDDPKEWLIHLEGQFAASKTIENQQVLKEMAQNFNWDNSVKNVLEKIAIRTDVS